MRCNLYNIISAVAFIKLSFQKFWKWPVYRVGFYLKFDMLKHKGIYKVSNMSLLRQLHVFWLYLVRQMHLTSGTVHSYHYNLKVNCFLQQLSLQTEVHWPSLKFADRSIVVHSSGASEEVRYLKWQTLRSCRQNARLREKVQWLLQRRWSPIKRGVCCGSTLGWN